MTCRKFVFLLLLFACLSNRWGHAQTAQLSGIVTDSSSAVLPTAQITVTRKDTEQTITLKVDSRGRYLVPSLAPGAYRISVTAPGFQRKVWDNVVLETASKADLHISLEVGSEQQSIVVNGTDVALNTTDGSTSTVVNRQFVQNIPLNGRSFQSLISMVPGTVAVPPQMFDTDYGQFSVNGQRTDANYFTVDGVSANGGATPNRGLGTGSGLSGSSPGNTALGTTQSLVSVDALEEFRAVTSTYSAEYGRTPGAQFVFTTRSGANRFHGSAFNYFRNDAMDARMYFNQDPQAKPSLRQNDFGGTFSGPIWIPHVYDGADRSFFFFAYEGLRLRTPGTVTGLSVPTTCLRGLVPAALKNFVNAFPVANSGDLACPGSSTLTGNGLALWSGSYSVPGNLDTSSLRLDHKINDRFKVFVRYNHAPSETDSRDAQLMSIITHNRSGVEALTAGTINMLSDRLTNDLRFNFTANTKTLSYGYDSIGGAQPWDLYATGAFRPDSWAFAGFNMPGGYSYSYETPASYRQHQINVVDSVVYSRGQHALKFGLDYRRVDTPLDAPAFQTSFFFSDVSQMLTNLSLIPVVRYDGPFEPVFSNLSLYAQDEWHATRKLNLSLGIRWELNPAPRDANGNDPYTVDQIGNLATTHLMPRGTDLWKTTYTNFAPRLGFAYRVHEQPGQETVVRGGFGMYYDTGNNQAASGYGGVGASTTQYFYGAFPLTGAQFASIPPPSITPPYAPGTYFGVFAYNPNLKLPYIFQWSAAVEQQIGQKQSVSLSYVGSAGRRQLATLTYYPAVLGNPYFNSGGTGTGLTLTDNRGTSDYDALQVQLDRRISQGLQFHVAYTWSHSIDEVSTNFATTQLLRGNSDFDIRNNFQVALVYNVPGTFRNRVASSLLKDWSVDLREFARSSAPVNVVSDQGINFALGASLVYQADVVPGQPFYLHSDAYPGHRRINPAAFTIAPAGQNGDLGRNALRGFDAVQTDVALRREFRLAESFRLQARIESFNMFNHPVMGAINSNLNVPSTFGLASSTLNNQLSGFNPLYQVGGPRSTQLALKLQF